jgi:hypothetical protein
MGEPVGLGESGRVSHYPVEKTMVFYSHSVNGDYAPDEASNVISVCELFLRRIKI